MKKLLILAVILFTLSSCSRYMNTGGGGCGVWMPKKFERDTRATRWVREARVRNGWNRHF